MDSTNKIELIQNCGVNLEKAFIYIAADVDNTLGTFLRIKVDMIEEYYLNELHKDLQRVKLFVNSHGGDIYAIGATLDFYQELKARGILVDVHTEGICESAATFIVGGATGLRTSSRTCRWMVHELQVSSDENTPPQSQSQLQIEQTEVNYLQNELYKRYAEITRKKGKSKASLQKSIKEWTELCRETYYFSAEAAKNLGLIDEVLEY